MACCLNLFIGLCLLILQTSIVPDLPFFDRFYNLLTPYIVYLGLYRPARDGLPLTILIGFVMDNFSGGPFGLYLVTYLWVFAGTRRVVRFFRVGFNPLLPLVLVAAVVFENALLIGTLALLRPGAGYQSIILEMVSWQIFWAFLTGAFVIPFLHFLHVFLLRRMGAFRLKRFVVTR